MIELLNEFVIKHKKDLTDEMLKDILAITKQIKQNKELK